MRNRKKNKNIRLLLAFGLLLMFFFSCVKEPFFDRYIAIEDCAWDKGSEYFFNFTIADNTVPYNIFLKVRNNDKYPFKNLWLFYDIRLPDSTLANDTIETVLADDFGKWTGKGITLHHSEFPLYANYHFPDTGRYTIVFRQGMRENVLMGIEAIGLMIEKPTAQL